MVMPSEPLLKAGVFNIQVDVPENPDKVSLLSLREHPVFRLKFLVSPAEKKVFFMYTKHLTI